MIKCDKPECYIKALNEAKNGQLLLKFEIWKMPDTVSGFENILTIERNCNTDK